MVEHALSLRLPIPPLTFVARAISPRLCPRAMLKMRGFTNLPRVSRPIGHKQIHYVRNVLWSHSLGDCSIAAVQISWGELFDRHHVEVVVDVSV